MANIELVRRALAKHRGQPSPALRIDFPIDWQMDADLGEVLSKDLRDLGSKWEIRRATPTLGDMIPAKAGLYMFVFRSYFQMPLASDAGIHTPAWVLYVGRAGNASTAGTLKDRYRREYANFVCGNLDFIWQDQQGESRSDRLNRCLSIWPLEYWYVVVEQKEKICSLENRLIKLFAPPLNRNGKLRPSSGGPKPAFRTPL